MDAALPCREASGIFQAPSHGRSQVCSQGVCHAMQLLVSCVQYCCTHACQMPLLLLHTRIEGARQQDWHDLWSQDMQPGCRTQQAVWLDAVY